MDTPELRAYLTLPAFFRTRGLTAVEPPVETEKFSAIMRLAEHVCVHAVAKDGKRTCVIILSETGKYITKGAEIESLINTMLRRDKDGGEPAEIIIVSPEVTLSKKNITVKVFSSLRSKKPGVCFSLVPYSILAFDVMNIHGMGKYSIVQEKRVLNGIELPSIRSSDPPIFWIGARPGQTVRIDTPSQNALRSVQYRQVVR